MAVYGIAMILGAIVAVLMRIAIEIHKTRKAIERKGR